MTTLASGLAFFFGRGCAHTFPCAALLPSATFDAVARVFVALVGADIAKFPSWASTVTGFFAAAVHAVVAVLALGAADFGFILDAFAVFTVFIVAATDVFAWVFRASVKGIGHGVRGGAANGRDFEVVAADFIGVELEDDFFVPRVNGFPSDFGLSVILQNSGCPAHFVVAFEANANGGFAFFSDIEHFEVNRVFVAINGIFDLEILGNNGQFK